MDLTVIGLGLVVFLTGVLIALVTNRRMKERKAAAKKAASHAKRSAAQKAAHARRKEVPPMPRNETGAANAGHLGGQV